jgi:type IV secretory pathway TrbF-like protein
MAPSTNGRPPDAVETDPMMQKIILAYDEVSRRDTNAERQRDRLASVARYAILAFMGLLAVYIWREVSRKPIEAFVQVVIKDDKDNYILSGLPQKLLEYTPEQGQWEEMLAQWTRSVRWRGENPDFTRTEWAWAYRHSCPDARTHLDYDQTQQKPFAKDSSKRVSVDIKSVSKTPTPESFQVLFEEVTTDTKRPTKQVALWTGTFTVGRYHPKTMADMIDNRLGLCVTGYNFTEQAKK